MAAKKVVAKKPSKEDITREVLEGMCEGLSLRKSCLAAGTNTPTFMRWVSDDADLAEQYAHAREALLDKIADDTLHYADEAVGMTDNGSTDSGAVAKQRLQVDTRKWLLSKLAPKKYGDKVALTGGDDSDKPVAFAFAWQQPPATS